MAARVAQAPNNLEWTVTRQLRSDWMRPLDFRAADEINRFGQGWGFGPFALLFGLLWSVVTLPLLPVVIALRRRGRLAWTIRATARPWGRKGPPMILRYHVYGNGTNVDAVMSNLVTRLEAGDGAPVLAGADRID